MAEFLKLKKSNCKNCYKCIRHCPVKSIRFSAGQAHIVNDECILCGQCFVVCPQDAKQIVSEREIVKVLLSSEKKTIASIAPSFVANYDGAGLSYIEDALKKLGFFGAEETAIGATIVKKDYENTLKEEKPNILISSCCHSVNLLIAKYFPSCLPYLAKTLSPMQAHGADIKKRYEDANVVFIGPCVAKKDEADMYKGYVDAVLTFEELTNWLKEENIEIEPSRKHIDEGRARSFPTSGGILRSMDKDEDNYTYMVVDGTENCIAALKDIEKGKLKNAFIEMSACIGSCIGGPVMEKYHRMPLTDYAMVNSYAGKKDFEVDMPQKTELIRDFCEMDSKKVMPGEREITEILAQMGKTRPEHELNCGSCGYNTCREKAVAVYQGKAEISMCLPYLKDKAENFSDNIINNSPNGIIVLNESLEVQQINRSAMDIMNIRRASDVLGDGVVRILDPSDFIKVRESAIALNNKKMYLAEYKKYIRQSIIYDKDYKILISFMKDITDDEESKEKKESISRQTAEIADKVVDKQMRVVQEIASLLGETTAETKIALTKLKESIKDE